MASQIYVYALMVCPTPNDVQAMSITESVLIPLLPTQRIALYLHLFYIHINKINVYIRPLGRIKAFNTPPVLCSACNQRLLHYIIFFFFLLKISIKYIKNK